MLERGAPNTMRMPISAVRWRTIVDSTPYSPTPARITATTAKIPISVAVNRIGAIALSTNVVIGWISASGARGSTCATAATDRGDDLVRIAAGPDGPADGEAVAEMPVHHENRFRSRRRQRRVTLMSDDADDLVPLGLGRGDPQQQPLPHRRLATERQRGEVLVDDDLARHVGLLIDDVVGLGEEPAGDRAACAASRNSRAARRESSPAGICSDRRRRSRCPSDR